MSNRIRVGVIGSSFGAEVHIPGFQSLPEYQVVGIASGRRERAEATARQFGIPFATDDYRELLARADVDMVSVATPVYLHHPVTVDAFAAGKHVLCEKPLALNRQQGAEMLAAARDSGKAHMVNYELRFLPGRQKIKELLDAGYVGEPRMVVGEFFGPFKGMHGRDVPWDWLAVRSLGGGFFGAKGCHYVDLYRWWFGEVTGVYATLETKEPLRKVPGAEQWRPVETEDCFIVMLRTERGVQGTICVSRVVRHGTGGRIMVYGSEGTLILTDEGLLTGARRGDKRQEPLLTPGQMPQAGITGAGPQVAFPRLAREMARAIREGVRVAPDMEDGLRAQEVTDAIFRSSAERRWVGLPLEP